MLTRRHLLGTTLAGTAAAAVAACSPSNTSGGSTAKDGNSQTLTFRLWDEVAAPVFEESLKAFTKKTGIAVKVDLVPWADYWTKLPLDVNDPSAAPDVFWLNTANFPQFLEGKNLVNVTEALGKKAIEQWQPLTSEMYTREGSLWGVPQIWDSIAVLYNKTLAKKAGIDLSQRLTFDPSASTDSLREAAGKLTTDKNGKHPGEAGFDKKSVEVFGFNAQADFQAILGPFVEASGAHWAADNKYAFGSPQGVAAFDYLAKMINEWGMAPSAADTNENGDHTKDLFIQGKLGLFQTGPYSLKSVGDAVGDTFEWGVAPLTGGPAGAFTNAHAVAAAGNAKSKNPEGVKKLLEFLGSEEGQRPLGENGISFPAHKNVQTSFVDFWKKSNVDVSEFITSIEGPDVSSTTASNGGLALDEAMSHFKEVLVGNVPASEGIPAAQKAGNDVLGS